MLIMLSVIGSVAIVSAHPVLTVYGEEEATVQVFSEYEMSEHKAVGRLLWMEFDLEADTAGEVDTGKLGTYTVKHSADFMGKTATVSQRVNVVDTVKPTLEAEQQNFEIEYSGSQLTPDDIKVSYTASDNYDGDLTHKVQKAIDGDVCRLTVSDSSGNTAQCEINIIVNDGVRPTIVLSGPSTVYVAVGGSYNEPGYSAKDNKDGNITSKVEVSSGIDLTRSGTYYKNYTVTDEAGNSAKVTRKVIVYGSGSAEDYENIQSNGKTVYLTFDDGPGAYTERLLGYLDRYGVKATFFVTNQFPRYQSIIKATHDKGHKVAIHTCSHQIYSKDSTNIYSSVSAYMKDFNAMQDIIVKQTGRETNIFRFPGGTNNTVSKSHCKGIMTDLAQQMTDAGYIYFDWNVDSYDSRSTTTTQNIISETISQISKKTDAVVLMHDIHKKTVEAVPAIIEYCLQNGYSFKVLDENSPSVRFRPVN